jgi:RNA polymerase sigma-70 factor (ECF subfamily)
LDREATVVIYCVVPGELAPKLHDALRAHFRDDSDVEVVVERRNGERRRSERRGAAATASDSPERRRIRNVAGRRIADRRATAAAVEPPRLPRRAQPYADRLVFVERIAPTGEQAEDVDTARLVTRIQAGETEGYSELYLRYFDRVYGYLRVILRGSPEAEDLAQQVFVKVLEGLPSYERRTQPFRAWLFAVVRNTVVDELRRRHRLEVVDPHALDRQREERGDTTEGELGALRWITDRELLLFIERLPIAYRQVLLLRFMLDLPSREIAVIVGRTPEDVRKLQERGLRFLRARLAAVGRGPRHGGRIPLRARWKPLNVLRERRFALH